MENTRRGCYTYPLHKGLNDVNTTTDSELDLIGIGEAS